MNTAGKRKAQLKTIFSYNQSEVKTDGSLEDLANGFNVWVDFADPDHQELMTYCREIKKLGQPMVKHERDRLSYQGGRRAIGK